MKSISLRLNDEEEEEEGDMTGGDSSGMPDMLGMDSPAAAPQATSKPQGSNNLLDFLDEPAPAPSSGSGGFGSMETPSDKKQWIAAEQGNGVFINGNMVKRNNQIVLEMDIGNKGSNPVSQLAIQFNKNTFGLTPSNINISLGNPVMNGSSASASVVVTCTPPMLNNTDVSLNLQVAMKNVSANSVFYFSIPVAMETLFTPNATMDVSALANAWKGMDENLEVSQIVNGE